MFKLLFQFFVCITFVFSCSNFSYAATSNNSGGTSQQQYVKTYVNADFVYMDPNVSGSLDVNDNSVVGGFGGQGANNEEILNPPSGTITPSETITPIEPDPFQEWIDEQEALHNTWEDNIMNDMLKNNQTNKKITEDAEAGYGYDVTLKTETNTTQVKKNRTVLYYCWLFKNDDPTVPILEKQTPQLSTVQSFGYSGIWTVTATPWCKWDVGYYETYTMEIQGNISGTKQTITRQRFVKTGETEGLYPPGKSTWVISISLEDLFKDVEFPCVELEIEAIDEETE